MPLNCEDIIRRQINRSMTEEEVREFAREGKRLAAKAQAGQGAAVSGKQIAAMSKDYAQREAMAKLAKERARKLQEACNLRAYNFAMEKFKGMEWEGLSALLVGSKYNREGGRMSVDALRSSLTGRYVGGMLADMKEAVPGYVKLLRNKAFSREVAEALWDIGKENPTFRGREEAAKLANVIHKWEERARVEENNAGAWINQLPGYICRQSHDQLKLRKAGFEVWREEIGKRLDWDKTAGGRLANAADDERETFLYEAYTGLVTGMHHSFGGNGDPLARAHAIGSTAARASHQRVLHFKSGGDWFDYNERFGRGELAEAVVSGLTKSANDTALMKILGPSPQVNLENLIMQVKEAFRSRGDADSIRKVNNYTKRLRNEMAELDGTLNMEGNPRMATVSRCIRALESMAKLGGAVISGFSDIPLFAQEMAYQGRGYFKSMAEGLALFAKGRGTLEEQRILSECGVFFDSMCGNLMDRFSGNDMPGKLTSMMNMFFKMNLLNFWTDAWKKSATLMMSHDLASLAGQSFGQLSAPRQRALSLYGIDEGIWEMLRGGAMSAADGRSYLTPEAVQGIPKGKIEAYMTGKGMITDADRAEAFRRDMADMLRSYFRDRVQYAVLEPDARTASIIHQGLAAGTVPGEALRFVMQFKSFPVAFLQRTMSREIYGRGADTALQGLKGAFIPRHGELSGLAGMIVATTIFGYLSMSAKALVAGRTPRDFTESPEAFGKTLLAALVQGGGMGLYGDFLFGEKSRMGDDFLSSLAGPGLGSLSSLVSLYKSARDGEDVSSTAFRTLWSHLPGNNLFWTKTALDQVLLNSVYEYLNPGYLKRTRRRMERETNQEFYLEPHVWDWASR